MITRGFYCQAVQIRWHGATIELGKLKVREWMWIANKL